MNGSKKDETEDKEQTRHYKDLQARQAEEPSPTFSERATKAMQGGEEV